MSIRSLTRTPLRLALGLSLAACAGAAQATSITMYRDPNCGCCLAWLDHADDHFAKGDETVASKTIDSENIAAVKAANGVPADLVSCHTAIVDGMVIEGHVPAADVERLLAERPEGITGLAVAGMPLGSPGMEMGARRQAFQVIAFGPDKRMVWASYPAS
ncbi:DUF411 domain-containing protein [Qipengyuania sp. 1XM1-15A]|uniref:DUF411 domain-containing protein n=1 Tax=Qipengyuania xiamenensis TaxID=2867237 RepID=UPI001C873DB3|nr:DUF411 domain-containing protein [Qipengyuania xiamenensis]MBX7531885.1 DUF411 domain-containing protein [Qipengyuania xiamenensis]